jgi:hypothetical protein
LIKKINNIFLNNYYIYTLYKIKWQKDVLIHVKSTAVRAAKVVVVVVVVVAVAVVVVALSVTAEAQCAR